MHLNNILTHPQLVDLLDDLRKNNKRIVFTNGVFDILHIGHVRYLEKARALGDVLIVGVNSDKSVSKLKGKSRPITNQADRAAVLAALKCVDYVTIFNDDTPVKLLQTIKPNYHVKGGDYKSKDLPEYKTIIDNGGKVVIINYVKGKSTTAIIAKIKRVTEKD